MDLGIAISSDGRRTEVNTWRAHDECWIWRIEFCLIYHKRELWRRSETRQGSEMIDGSDTFTCRRYETWTPCTDMSYQLAVAPEGPPRTCVWTRPPKSIRRMIYSSGWCRGHKLGVGVMWIVEDDVGFFPLFYPTEIFSQSLVSTRRSKKKKYLLQFSRTVISYPNLQTTMKSFPFLYTGRQGSRRI